MATSIPKPLIPGNDTCLFCNDPNAFCSKAYSQKIYCCQELWKDPQVPHSQWARRVAASPGKGDLRQTQMSQGPVQACPMHYTELHLSHCQKHCSYSSQSLRPNHRFRFWYILNNSEPDAFLRFSKYKYYK